MGGTTLIAIITFLISAAVCVPTGMVLRKKQLSLKLKVQKVKQKRLYKMQKRSRKY